MTRSFSIFLLMFATLFGALAPAVAQTTPASSAAPMTQDKLDALLAPIALYPDQLLAQVLMASTYPLDVVAAARFVKANKELKGDALDKAVEGKEWDPAVMSLTAFPQALEMMNDKLEWTQELGDAFLEDEKAVMQTVQNLRQKAKSNGNLNDSEQQKVIVQEKTIVIEPANPQVVYVPAYNPTVVYGTWWAPAYPPFFWYPPPYYGYPVYRPGAAFVGGMIGFGVGLAIANNHWGWCNSNWGGGNVNINVNHNNTFVNNKSQYKNTVKNGQWQHSPEQRKGVAYNNQGTREKFQKSDPAAVSARRESRGHEGASSRDTPRAGTADRASTRDTSRPDGAGRPNASTGDVHRPGGAERPSTRDFSRPEGGGRQSASTNDMRAGGGSADRSFGGHNSATTRQSPSFDSSGSRSHANAASNRGASSRAGMGGGGRAGGGGGRGGGRGR